MPETKPPHPFSADFFANPYPVYHQFRTQDPIIWLESLNTFFVTQHADVSAILKDPRFGHEMSYRHGHDEFRAQMPAAAQPLFRLFDNWMLFRDPPDHTRLRELVNLAFTPRIVHKLRPRIEAIAAELTDALLEADEVDLIREYAFPLPVIVIAELLGISPEDRQRFKDWSQDLVATFGPLMDPEAAARGGASALEISAYLRDIIARRRQDPREDLISGLIAAEERGHRLTEEELVATCILLLVAGHETTVNLIGNGILALLQHPDQEQRLRQNPTLIEPAVEEFLRFESPVQMTSRFAKEDVTLGGRLIRKGQVASVILGAANRDPAVFTEPDALDISRAVNPHLAFATGIHYCVGAPLARAEGQIAIQHLLQRFPQIELRSAKPAWREAMVLRGLTVLPVSLRR